MGIPRRLAHLLTAGAVAAASAITAVSTVAYAATPPLIRLAGPDRIGTALAVAQQNPFSGGYVIIARADSYPDALAGAALAGAFQARLFLTPSDHLDERVLSDIASGGELQNVVVILLGTQDVMSANVARQLQEASVSHDSTDIPASEVAAIEDCYPQLPRECHRCGRPGRGRDSQAASGVRGHGLRRQGSL